MIQCMLLLIYICFYINFIYILLYIVSIEKCLTLLEDVEAGLVELGWLSWAG